MTPKKMLCTLTLVDADGPVAATHPLYAVISTRRLVLRGDADIFPAYMAPQHLYLTSQRSIGPGDVFVSFNDDESYLSVNRSGREHFEDYADERWTQQCRRLEMSTDPAHGVPAIPVPFLRGLVEAQGKGWNTVQVPLDELGRPTLPAQGAQNRPPQVARHVSAEQAAARAWADDTNFHDASSPAAAFEAGIAWERARVRGLLDELRDQLS